MMLMDREGNILNYGVGVLYSSSNHRWDYVLFALYMFISNFAQHSVAVQFLFRYHLLCRHVA